MNKKERKINWMKKEKKEIDRKIDRESDENFLK